MKKLLLSLGAVAAVVAPVATVVACGDSSDNGTTEDAKVSKDITVHKKDGKIVSVDIANFGANTMKEFQGENSPMQTTEGLLDFVKDEDANGGNVHFHLTADFKTTLKATKDVITLTEYNVLAKAAFPGMDGGDQHNSETTVPAQAVELTSTLTSTQLTRLGTGSGNIKTGIDHDATGQITDIEREMGITFSDADKAIMNGDSNQLTANYNDDLKKLTVTVNGSGAAKTVVVNIKPATVTEIVSQKDEADLEAITLADVSGLDTVADLDALFGITSNIAAPTAGQKLDITFGDDNKTLDVEIVNNAGITASAYHFAIKAADL